MPVKQKPRVIVDRWGFYREEPPKDPEYSITKRHKGCDGVLTVSYDNENTAMDEGELDELLQEYGMIKFVGVHDLLSVQTATYECEEGGCDFHVDIPGEWWWNPDTGHFDLGRILPYWVGSVRYESQQREESGQMELIKHD